jgi:hypothetical protein
MSPISRDMMRLYPGGSIRSPEWQAIRERIRQRSGDKCERCGAPNGALIARGEGRNFGTYMLDDGEIRDIATGESLDYGRLDEYEARPVVVQLGVAHLDQDPSHNDDANLKHLCRGCHLTQDRTWHVRRRLKTIRGRRAIGDLFEE